jgi:hypothetical protein
MSTAKIALSIPKDVLQEVDAAARERGESRSGFVSRVLRAAIQARSDAEVTRRLDELFRDPAIAAQQLLVADQLDSAGTNWGDESW